MKEKPILFSTPMVQAILAGNKTQTRRVVTPHNSVTTAPWHELQFESSDKNIKPVLPDGLGDYRYLKVYNYFDGTRHRVFPRWEKGDVLWVRETWAHRYTQPINSNSTDFVFRASEDIDVITWKPSIHMPRKACRLFLKITGVRVERLHEISESDAIAEGVGSGFQMNAGWPDYQHIVNGICEVTQDTPELSYQTLWEGINGAESWEVNPYVWVIEFERMTDLRTVANSSRGSEKKNVT